jgi:ATP-binding cassette subfamily A (ABC1) protein 3
MGQIKGLSGNILNDDINTILEKTELIENTTKLTKSLSGGNKRKLSLAMALIGGS